MFLRTEILPEKKLVGQSKRMSFANNITFHLWSGFMPRRKEIQQTIGTDLYSLEVYDDLSFFKNFNPSNEFSKWAAVEVNSYENVPEGMEQLELPEGLYAVFLYKGDHSGAVKAYNHIFMEWLPVSGYCLDNRPHFAVMGEKYKKDDPSSEEEIWIPIVAV
jgi:AraC family transcriptional regulator